MDIISDMNRAIDIENINAEKKIAELEQIFQSLEAEIPIEERKAYLSSLNELYLKNKSTKTLDEQFEILEQISKLSIEFGEKYKEFIPSQVISYLELSILQLKVSKKLIYATVLVTLGFLLLTDSQERLASSLRRFLFLLSTDSQEEFNSSDSFEEEFSSSDSFEVDEVKYLAFLYTGLVKFQQIVEDYPQDIHPKVYDLLQSIAESIVNSESFKEYRGSKTKNTEQFVSNVRATRNTAKAILWEIKNIKNKNEKSVDFSSVGKLTEYIQTAPNWFGDDFEECLENINHNRP